MKLRAIHMTILVTALCVTGCTGKQKDTSSDGLERIPVSEVAVSNEEVQNIVKSCPNFTVSDDLKINVPTDVSEVYEYEGDYSDDAFQANDAFQVDMKEYDKKYRELFEYLFPNHPLNEDYLYYIGGSSKWEIDDNTNEVIQDYCKVRDARDKVLSGKEGRVQYFYDETWEGGITKWDSFVCLDIPNPMGLGYANINKGKTIGLSNKKYYDDDLQKELYPGLDGYDPSEYLEYVDTYSPDSKQEYQLADRKMSICDAVQFFENYINHFPSPKKKNASTVVTGVDVYRVHDEIYGYNLLTTKEYRGLLFDRARLGTYNGFLGYDDYNPHSGMAFMVESTDVDFICSYYVAESAVKEKKYSEVLSIENALKLFSSKLTDHVKFSLKNIELIYTEKYARTKEGYIDNETAYISPAWKITLENANDNLTYSCYINALDGEKFRYCTTPIDWWEDAEE